MLNYELVRAIHIACATASISLFAARGAMQLVRPGWRASRWLRILPHANDTVLLCAAITLAAMSGQYPFAQSWLTAKVLALVAYVGFGTVAMRPATPPAARKVAFALALMTVTYIVGVAIHRSATWGII